MCRCLNFGFWFALSFLSCQISSGSVHFEGEMSICVASPNCYILTRDFKKDVRVTNSKGLYTTFCHEGVGLLGLLSSGLIAIEKQPGFLGAKNIIMHHGKSIAKLEETVKSSWNNGIRAFSSNEEREYWCGKMDIIETSCILVEHDGDFNVYFKVTYFDSLNITMIVIGLILFSIARSFSQTKIPHYILGSALFVVGFFHFCVYKFVPKFSSHQVKTDRHKLNKEILDGYGFAVIASLSWWMFLVAVGGWTILVTYFVTLGVIGAGYIYRYYSITDYRTINIMTWSIQALALRMIWTGIQITEVGTTFCIGLIFVGYFWNHPRLSTGKKRECKCHAITYNENRNTNAINEGGIGHSTVGSESGYKL